MIKEQDNQYFTLTHNKELNCYDIVFKQASYDTSAELLGIMSFVHQLGVRNPSETVRIGAMINSLIKKCLECEADISKKISAAKFCCSTCANINWYKTNKEKKKARSYQYYHSNPEVRERIKAYSIKWKKENKDRHDNYTKEWRKNNKEKCIEYKRKSRKKADGIPSIEIESN